MPAKDDAQYCLKDDCPNETIHRSGYCAKCRTYDCPACKGVHTINEAPHKQSLRLCAQCRRIKGNLDKLKQGKI